MRDSYVSLRVGYIGYLFTATQLEPGFEAASIERPRPAVRLDFFGHHFTRNLSAQVTYMRPAQFVEYNDINGKNGNHPVSNAYAGLTFSWEQPLHAGARLVSRRRLRHHQPIRASSSTARPRCSRRTMDRRSSAVA